MVSPGEFSRGKPDRERIDLFFFVLQGSNIVLIPQNAILNDA
jgi:hypothetical protein